MNAPLYRQVLGDAFDTLPPRVRELHALSAPTLWRGRADVTRGTSITARLLATLMRLPPAGSGQPLDVHFTPQPTHEIWQRIFPSGTFKSRQYPAGAHILETVGPVTLILRPAASPSGLTLTMDGARVLGVPLPGFLVPRIATREFQADGRYRFEVSSSLPMLGPLVRYSGWLERMT